MEEREMEDREEVIDGSDEDDTYSNYVMREDVPSLKDLW